LKGCALSAVGSLIAGLAIGAAIWYSVSRVYDTPFEDTVGIAVLAGFFGWIAVNLLFSAAQAWMERSALVSGLAGTPPIDGRQAVLVGHIEPMGAPLVAPFSGTECVAYKFEISQMRGTGRQTFKAVYYDGSSATPSTIVTRAGSFRLLAVPEIEGNEANIPGETARRLAADFIARTTFEPPRQAFSRPAIEQQWSDTDGAYRRETRHVVDQEPNLADCTLSEWRLERGARVCLFGEYSAAQRAIVADPGDWSKVTRVMKGDPEAVVRQLRSRVIGRLIGGLVAAAAAAGVVAAFVSSAT
jgi:hypothetical protein